MIRIRALIFEVFYWLGLRFLLRTQTLEIAMNRNTFGRFASALFATALFTAASPATAAPPPTASDLNQEVSAINSCGEFGLRITGTDSKARVKTFKNGMQITSGKGFLLTYTNLVSGKSVTFETNGYAERISAPDADGILTYTATGSNGLILYDTDESEVEGVDTPSAIQYTGRIEYTVDPATGVFTLISASGKQRDICAELE